MMPAPMLERDSCISDTLPCGRITQHVGRGCSRAAQSGRLMQMRAMAVRSAQIQPLPGVSGRGQVQEPTRQIAAPSRSSD